MNDPVSNRKCRRGRVEISTGDTRIILGGGRVSQAQRFSRQGVQARRSKRAQERRWVFEERIIVYGNPRAVDARRRVRSTKQNAEADLCFSTRAKLKRSRVRRDVCIGLQAIAIAEGRSQGRGRGRASWRCRDCVKHSDVVSAVGCFATEVCCQWSCLRK